MTRAAGQTINNPIFARVWSVHVNHEAKTIPILRRENLVGLSGRVLEVGAGIGTNFAFYPPSVEQLVAIEPEPRLAARARVAAAVAPVPVDVIGETVESFCRQEQFDAVVLSFVLCSVRDPAAVLQQLHSQLLPGGELRYLEHVASAGGRGRWQRFLDATVWPRFLGNCHSHRDTERAVVDAGFEVDSSRREWSLPVWSPMPVSELALGRARRVL